MKPLPSYQSYKIVEALKISQIVSLPNGNRALVPEEPDYGPVEVSVKWCIEKQAAPGGYYVRYPDGYESYSPAGAFEAGYRALQGRDETVLRYVTRLVMQALHQAIERGEGGEGQAELRLSPEVVLSRLGDWWGDGARPGAIVEISEEDAEAVLAGLPAGMAQRAEGELPEPASTEPDPAAGSAQVAE